jgi:hypothetical protein
VSAFLERALLNLSVVAFSDTARTLPSSNPSGAVASISTV